MTGKGAHTILHKRAQPVHPYSISSRVCALFPYCPGLFYYTLGNIVSIWFEAIQLVSIVQHTLIQKYGLDKILQPFVFRVKELEKVCQC